MQLRPPSLEVRVPGSVPSLRRALTLLDRLARQREPMSLARLTTELDLPKSSVHGLCATLTSFGYLSRQPDGAFRIGPQVMSLAEAFVAGFDVAREFGALLAAGDTPTEETVVLAVLDGRDALYLGARNSLRPLGLSFNLGMRLPACFSGSGRALLAHRPAADVRALYAESWPAPLTRKSPRDVEALMRELASIRRRGWSVDDEAVRQGVHSFGAPVFDASGRAVAAVAVCIDRATLGADRGRPHREAALGLARALSLRLGGGSGGPVDAGPGAVR